MSRGSSTLAVHKEQVTPEQALARVQQIAKEKYDEAIRQQRKFSKTMDERLGGQSERLDASVVDQGRAWATRLAIIAKRNAGTSYSPSKTSIAVQKVVSKIYGAIGELEAIVASDIEIPLFATGGKKAIEQQFFGGDSTWADIRKVEPKELFEGIDLQDDYDREHAPESIADALLESVGEVAADDVREYLKTIEIVVELPEKAEGAQKKRPRSGRKPANVSVVDGAEYDDADGSDDE